jgi:hypothetical protein
MPKLVKYTRLKSDVDTSVEIIVVHQDGIALRDSCEWRVTCNTITKINASHQSRYVPQLLNVWY